MENLRKIYQELQEKEKFKAVITQAKEKFELKPFVQEHYPLKRIIQILRPVLSLFSIVTGFGFLAYQFANGLNFWVSATFALILLVFLELLKAEFSNLTFKRFFVRANNVGLNYSLLFFMLAFFALSVFLSVNGAKELYKQLDKSEVDFKSEAKTQQDSLLAYYNAQIQSEKAAVQSFKKSVEWQGKINLYDLTTAGILKSHTAKIDSLEKDKRLALTNLQTQASKQLSTLESNNGFNLAFWFWLSMLVEVLIILCLFFEIWYNYKVSQESELFETSPVFETDLSSLQGLIRMAGLYQSPELLSGPTMNQKSLVSAKLNTVQSENPQAESSSSPPAISFTQDKNTILVEDPYLKKHREIVKALCNGMTFEQIQATYRKSEPTIAKVSGMLQKLGILEERGRRKQSKN